MNVELYIAGKLCDIPGSDLAVRLKRQFIKPGDLNSKDAQRSYKISLPATPRNNEIFGYKNVEETGDKFSMYDDACLYVNGLKIFDGKFRLHEITRDSYSGYLGVPVPLSVSDIFGETAMNQAGEWRLPFSKIQDVSTYNEQETPPCIFPLVLYAPFTKVRDREGKYTDRTILDDTVKLMLDDLPPSVNCLQMLKEIFENAGYELGGTAFSDDRLANLYVSYRNPEDYLMPYLFNTLDVSGSWKNFRDNVVESNKSFYYYTGETGMLASIDLLHTTNGETVVDDGEDTYITRQQGTGKYTIIVPETGLYKLEFECDIEFGSETLTSTTLSTNIIQGSLDSSRVEVKVLRNYKGTMQQHGFDDIYYKDNLNQEIGSEEAVFPQDTNVHFIDPKQNQNFLAGFCFGVPTDIEKPNKYTNPLNTSRVAPMAIFGGKSWYSNPDPEQPVFRAYSAVHNPGYANSKGEETGRFGIEIENAPETYARVAMEIVEGEEGEKESDTRAGGRVAQLVWLEQEDRLDIVAVSKAAGSIAGTKSWHNQQVGFRLRLTPFQKDREWLQVDNDGNGTGTMNWEADGTFLKDHLNLMLFLPAGQKVDDWINQFCTAFNLSLEHAGGRQFELNIKDRGTVRKTSRLVDLDGRANTRHSGNEMLDIPQMYELGFTVDTNEYGYRQSISTDKETGKKILNSGEDGGGTFYTGSRDAETVSGKSNFSYCWYKDIHYQLNGVEKDIRLPVITEPDSWEEDYGEMMEKLYTDKPQRFWYKSGLLDVCLNDTVAVKAALVSNRYRGSKPLELHYKDESHSVLRTYFLLLTADRYYTRVECRLSPEEYNQLGYSLVKFNGDIYHVAEVDGYDPTGKSPGTLKLIRRLA